MNEATLSLRRAAREIFADALSSADAGEAVRRAVRLEGARLNICEAEFDLAARPIEIYCVAFGKAAGPMASALEEVLGDRLAGGVLSSSTPDASLPERWRVYAGGHPVPNEASLEAARASFDLLRRADVRGALVVFLVSGGGSAMIEWSRDAQTTLEELREANRVLVSCGASIAEINCVRRALSAVKGGGLAARAPRAAQVTLIVSDTNAGDEANVASGPTFKPELNSSAHAAADIVARYDLAPRLPASVLRVISRHTQTESDVTNANVTREHYVLLDNRRALESAAEAARRRGFVVEAAHDVVEESVEEGAAALVSRLVELLSRRASEGRGVCLVSGGEFACPVRGGGRGGRNAETALRCAFELEARASVGASLVALSAGTDGVDGNSPAAGALADHSTLARARALNLDARRFLEASDAYTFFEALGDTVVTGPTGTNVRDLRVLVASTE